MTPHQEGSISFILLTLVIIIVAGVYLAPSRTFEVIEIRRQRQSHLGLESWIRSGLSCRATFARLARGDCNGRNPIDIIRHESSQPIMLSRNQTTQMHGWRFKPTCRFQSGRTYFEIHITNGINGTQRTLFDDRSLSCPGVR